MTVDTEYIFHSPEGKAYQPNNWNNRVFLPFMRQLQQAHPEIPQLSVHEFRHTRASLWIAEGVDPYMAARLLGHTDLKMLLKIYDHTDTPLERHWKTHVRKHKRIGAEGESLLRLCRIGRLCRIFLSYGVRKPERPAQGRS